MKSTLTETDLALREKLWNLSLVDALRTFDQLDGSAANNGNADPQAARTLIRVSLFYLIIKVLGWKEYAHPWSYARILDVDREPNGCIDLWARGHGKSSIITYAKTIQDLCVFDDIAILVFSDTYENTKKHVGAIRTVLEQSDILKTLFPERFYKDPANEAKVWNERGFNIKRSKPRKEWSLRGSGFNRAFPTGYHSDVLLYDDVVTEDSVATADQVAKTKERYSQSKPLGSQESVERIIGTRYAVNDLFDDLITSGSYVLREHPVTDDGTLAGKLVMFTQSHWQHIIQPPMLAKTIANQYLLKPRAQEDAIFHTEKLQRYEVRENFMSVVILVDPAHTKKKHSNETAIVVLGIGGKRRKYLLDGLCQKMNLGERYLALRGLFWKWRRKPGIEHVVCGYETYGRGSSDVEGIRLLMERDRMQWQPMQIVELEDPTAGRISKEQRILRIQPDIDNYQILIPYETDASRLTTRQRQAIADGNEDLIAQPIRCMKGEMAKDARGNLIRGNAEEYDLTKVFIKQLEAFPTGSIDVIDAFSRVYDMNLTDPQGATKAYCLPDEELT